MEDKKDELNLKPWILEFFTDETKPKEAERLSEKQGHSEDVLIDIDGWRKFFRVGVYDHEADEWRLHDKSMQQHLDRKHMKWTYLPIYKGPVN